MCLIVLAGISLNMHRLKFHAHLEILSDSITCGLIKFPLICTPHIATYGVYTTIKYLHGDGNAPKIMTGPILSSFD